MDALILVDIQNDFCPGGALAVRDGDAVVPVANALMRHFELVVASQDFHPRAHLSFAINHPGKREHDVIDLDGLQQVLWPAHCVQGTPGCALHPALDRARIDAVFSRRAPTHASTATAASTTTATARRPAWARPCKSVV